MTHLTQTRFACALVHVGLEVVPLLLRLFFYVCAVFRCFCCVLLLPSTLAFYLVPRAAVVCLLVCVFLVVFPCLCSDLRLISVNRVDLPKGKRVPFSKLLFYTQCQGRHKSNTTETAETATQQKQQSQTQQTQQTHTRQQQTHTRQEEGSNGNGNR